MSEENMNFTSDIIASWVIRLHDDIQANKINRNTEAALFYLLEYIFGHAATEIMTPGTISARLFGEGASDNAECCIFIRSKINTINRWLNEDRYKIAKKSYGFHLRKCSIYRY